MVRYLTPAFPAFVALAADLRDRIIVTPSLLLLTVFVLFFVTGIHAGI